MHWGEADDKQFLFSAAELHYEQSVSQPEHLSTESFQNAKVVGAVHAAEQLAPDK